MSDDETPTQIGPYRVLRRLAVGGMAEVYVARTAVRLGVCKLVALKRVREKHTAKPEYVRMFRDEVRILATLDHPNIPRIYDSGTDDGVPYCTMELVDGVTLGELVNLARRRGLSIPLDCTISMIVEASAALHHAHEQTADDGTPLRIVHRDVSPTNIVLGVEGQVKVIDFGVAQAERRETETRDRQVKGRLGYMSPEQCLGKAIDRRSDVFSLAVLLYELTTGRRAFVGTNYEVLSNTASRNLPRPSRVSAGYPAELEEIVMRALGRSREARYASMSQFGQALESFAASRGLDLGSRSRSALVCELVGRRSPAACTKRATRLRFECGDQVMDDVTPSAPECEVVADTEVDQEPRGLRAVARLRLSESDLFTSVTNAVGPEPDPPALEHRTFNSAHQVRRRQVARERSN